MCGKLRGTGGSPAGSAGAVLVGGGAGDAGGGAVASAGGVTATGGGFGAAGGADSTTAGAGWASLVAAAGVRPAAQVPAGVRYSAVSARSRNARSPSPSLCRVRVARGPPPGASSPAVRTSPFTSLTTAPAPPATTTANDAGRSASAPRTTSRTAASAGRVRSADASTAAAGAAGDWATSATGAARRAAGRVRPSSGSMHSGGRCGMGPAIPGRRPACQHRGGRSSEHAAPSGV